MVFFANKGPVYLGPCLAPGCRFCLLLGLGLGLGLFLGLVSLLGLLGFLGCLSFWLLGHMVLPHPFWHIWICKSVIRLFLFLICFCHFWISIEYLLIFFFILLQEEEHCGLLAAGVAHASKEYHLRFHSRLKMGK